MDKGILFLLLAVVVGFILLLLSYRKVEAGEKGVVVTLGKPGKEVGPGPHFVVPLVQGISTIDARDQLLNPSFQEVLAKDMIPLKVDLVLTTRVVNARRALFEVKNPLGNILYLVQAMLVDVIGNVTSSQAVTDPAVKETINKRLEEMATVTEGEYGVNMSKYGLQQLRLPKSLEDAITGAEAALHERDRIVTLANAEAEQTTIERKVEDPYWIEKVKWDALQQIKPQIIVEGSSASGLEAAVLAKLNELINKLGGGQSK